MDRISAKIDGENGKFAIPAGKSMQNEGFLGSQCTPSHRRVVGTWKHDDMAFPQSLAYEAYSGKDLYIFQ